MIEKLKETKLWLGFVKLKKDMEPMTFSQKVEHIWMYYKEVMLVALGFLCLVVICIASAINASKDVMASGMMVNISISQEGFDYLHTDYLEHLGGEEGKQVVELDYTYFGDLMDESRAEENYNATMILPARVSGKMLDYMILDKFAMETYIMYEVYLDLRDFFTEDELAQLAEENRVIYAQQAGEEDRWPVAVDISDLAFVKDNIKSDSKIYFALSGSTQRPEICRDMWEYLHAWKKSE